MQTLRFLGNYAIIPPIALKFNEEIGETWN